MGYAGPKAISKVNMILKDKKCNHGLLGNPLKKKVKPSKAGAEAMIKAREENVKPQEAQSTPSVSEFVANRKKGLLQKKGCKKKYRK
tara:strand:- start:340 stop:600 length:261 start_codon:yes stop_codon:yes gene_type:complete